MDLTFRETQVGDIEDMFSVRARTRQNPISKEHLAMYGITSASSAADMASGRMKGWGCFHHSTLVGFCNGDSTTGELLVLAVLAEYEGNGIGTRLLFHVVEWLRSIGFQRPWLAASPDPRIRAHGFYRSLGWQPTGQSLENGDEILELKPIKAMQPTFEDARG
jgi:GNAT superfamily N-acetyltransferase